MTEHKSQRYSNLIEILEELIVCEEEHKGLAEELNKKYSNKLDRAVRRSCAAKEVQRDLFTREVQICFGKT